MPFNGSNTFSIVNTFVPGTTILSSAVNANFSDIATGLSDCVTLDAQAPVTGNLKFGSTGYIGLPTGTTAQRPASPAQGYFRFNSSLVVPEYYDGTAWDSAAPTINPPQGYLTLTSVTPVITADVTAATAVYYTPYTGQLCPVYNGTSFVNQIFAEQTLTLVSQHTASTIYDVFAFLNSGTFTIGTGPAWSNSTAGSCARGTGAGTTQLQRIAGLYTNQQQITARNGATTYTVTANQGTYLGSIFIDGSAGQVSCYRAFGQSRKWGVWNAYNRIPVILEAGDGTATWTYQVATIRPSNNASANSITTFCGLAEEEIQNTFIQLLTITVSSGNGQSQIGIGFNSTTAFSGTTGFSQANGTLTTTNSAIASYTAVPALGINTITCLEKTPTVSAATNTYNGGQSQMVLRSVWRA